MPSYELQRTFDASVDTVEDAAHDSLLALGAEVHESGDGMTMSGTTGFTLFSFGETVEIQLAPDGDGTSVTVSSVQGVRIAVADLGQRNRKNVGSIMNSVASRLAGS